MIADMLSKQKCNPIVTDLFIGGRKLNIPVDFITQTYLAVWKNIRLNSTHYFITKGKESFNKSHLIIHQILTFKNLLQNHIF